MEKVDQSQQETEEYIVTPNPISRERQKARDLLWDLPEDLSGVTVTIDASQMKFYGHPFIDEILRLILGVRNADSMKILSKDDFFRFQVRVSAELRDLRHRITFV